MSVDRQQFAEAVLQAGGWPATQSNINFLVAWMNRESTAAAFNPFATKLKYNNSYDLPGNSPGDALKVQQYHSFEDGVHATVATLQGNGYFTNVRAALASGDATSWDQQGKLAYDLHAWSAGPNAKMSEGYTSVTGGGILGNIGNLARDFVSTVGSTVGGAASDAQQAAQNAQAANGDIDGFLKSQAPEIARALGDPEVQQLLQKWGANQLSDDEFQTQLEQTSWWRNTPQNQRQMLVQQATDPASATQNLQNQMASVDKLGWQLGVHMTPQDVYNIALDSLKNGWDSAEIQQQVAAKFNYTGQQLQGAAGTDLSSLQKMYSDYALPTSPQDLNSKLGLILSGKQSAQDVEAQLQQQAATFYAANPQLSDFLKSGQGSVRSWASPLISKAASTLGLDPNSIDLTSPQWTFLLKPQTNQQTGQSTGMAQTLDSVEQTIKTDPVYGYSRTANGVQDYTNMVLKLQQAFTGGGV